MNWRWRKSISFGPIRTTLSKRGIGWSMGISGLRYGINAEGKKYLSVGIPGTSLYGIHYFEDKQTIPAPLAPTLKPPAPAEKWWQQKNFPKE